MSTTNTIGHQISYNRNQQSVSITYNDAKGNKTVVTIFANSDGNKTFDVGDKIVVKATDAKGMACTPQVDAGLIDNLLGYINGKTIDAVTELKDLQSSGNLFDPSRIDNNGVIEEITTFGALSKAATQDVAYPPNSDMPYYSYPNSDDLCSLVMGSIPKYYSSDSDVMPFNAPNIDSPTLNQTSSRPVAYYQGLQPYSYSPDYTYGTKDLYYLVSDYMSNDWTQANADYGQNIDNILSLGTNIETVIPTEDTPSTNNKQSASTQNANGTPSSGTNIETVIPTEGTPGANNGQSKSASSPENTDKATVSTTKTQDNITTQDCEDAYEKLGLSADEKKYIDEFLSSEDVPDEKKKWIRGSICEAVNLKTSTTIKEENEYEVQIKRIKSDIQTVLYWHSPSIQRSCSKTTESGKNIALKLYTALIASEVDTNAFGEAIDGINADNVLEVLTEYTKHSCASGKGEGSIWAGMKKRQMPAVYYDLIIGAVLEKAKKLGIHIDSDEAYGAFSRVYKEELAKNSPDLQKAMKLFEPFLKKVYQANYAHPETAFFCKD